MANYFYIYHRAIIVVGALSTIETQKKKKYMEDLNTC